MVAITFTWTPNPLDLGDDFRAFANELSDMSDPMTRSVNEVISRSIKTNFSNGGRPSWQPLAAYTIEKKGHADILSDSGKLESAASDPKSWDIGPQEAKLTDFPDYGVYQNEGFYNVPFNVEVGARQWAMFQPGDVDDIEQIFIEWIEDKFEDAVSG